jgi:hypothetical protein
METNINFHLCGSPRGVSQLSSMHVEQYSLPERLLVHTAHAKAWQA